MAVFSSKYSINAIFPLGAGNRVGTTLAAGEVRGLIGPNGSGKTTLLNLIGGRMPPDAGEIRLGDRSIQGLPPDALAALGVARTFQLPRVFRHMTVLENVLLRLCADHRRAPWSEGRAAARCTLEVVGLDTLAQAVAMGPTVRRVLRARIRTLRL